MHRLSSRMTSKHLLKLVQELSGLTFSDYSSSPNDSGTASISQLFLCSRSTSSGASTRSSVKSSGPQSHLLRDSSQPLLKGFGTANAPTLQVNTQLDPPLYKPHLNLRDNTKLNEAWNFMLRKRLLAPQITSVLPMYLPTTFAHVRALPPLQISLPLDSFIRNRPESTMNKMFIGSLVNNRHLDTRKHRIRKIPTRGDLSI